MASKKSSCFCSVVQFMFPFWLTTLLGWPVLCFYIGSTPVCAGYSPSCILYTVWTEFHISGPCDPLFWDWSSQLWSGGCLCQFCQCPWHWSPFSNWGLYMIMVWRLQSPPQSVNCLRYSASRKIISIMSWWTACSKSVTQTSMKSSHPAWLYVIGFWTGGLQR